MVEIEAKRNIVPITVEAELQRSYLDYAMSVIVGRALPDVRDGLKPVHRRVLYAMYELKNDWNKPYKKSARVVGDVIGKYHPHGESAVYDAIVRMAQDFSMRYVLVDGQGNFGSVDGDSAAAMRYTEIRMKRLTHMLLMDIEKETVDFVPNYDNSEHEPSIMPARYPNLLVNGSSGIAVGMATNIPPHNLGEIINATVMLIDNHDASIDDLMTCVSGPDFPTAGIINGRAGIVEAYRTGRGKIYMRAAAYTEQGEGSEKSAIIISELPYQVNKARLLEKIAHLVKDKKVEGITGIRDESDRQGMRVVIDVRRGENAEVILNHLYAMTQLQTVFGINMVVLHRGRPLCMNLKMILEAFIEHRRDVVTRRVHFDLAKARNRGHTLEGLALALAHIDEMINLIKQSPNPTEAKAQMLSRGWAPSLIKLDEQELRLCRPHDLSDQYGLRDGEYYLSPQQAQAILDLRLHRLTGLEQDKIMDEHKEIVKQIKYLDSILRDYSLLMSVIREELITIKNDFADERRTVIHANRVDVNEIDLIPQEDLAVTLSYQGYAKTQTLDSYRAQRRGGRGKTSGQIKEEDYIKFLNIANSHDVLLCFSNAGRVYWLKVYELPYLGRTAKGKPIVNFLPLDEGEVITAMLPVRDVKEDKEIVMVTERGVIKRVKLEVFSRPRASGVIALDLQSEDHLIAVEFVEHDDDIMLFSQSGKAVRFSAPSVRCMGRGARGVRGILLKEPAKLVALIVVKGHEKVLLATENGYGKQTSVEDFRKTSRGCQGVIAIHTKGRNGSVIGAVKVEAGHEALLISDRGTLVRLRVDDISTIGRNTMGVRLVNLVEDEYLCGLQAFQELAEETGEVMQEGEGTEAMQEDEEDDA